MFTTLSSAPESAEATPSTGNKRISMIWIPATLSVGLALAAVYLGARIVTAHPRPHPAQQVSAPRSPVKPQEAIPPPPPPIPVSEDAAVTPPVVETGAETIAPEAGKLYIQLAALGTDAASGFVQRMRDQELHPHLAPGPSPEIVRVLLGPFDSAHALNAAKAQLDDKGIKHFVRRY